MKAITYTQYGGPDVLRLVDVEILEPAAGQVRVRVHAASVNPVDVKLRRGDMATVMPATFPVIPGIDLAGVVDAVGEDVGHIRAGDAVLGFAVSGSYAEYALASVVAVKPKALDWELAASVPTVGETAARVLRQLGLTTGQTLLVHGAAGSVGAVVTQLAVRRGLTVIGSTGPAGEATVRAHGATPVAYGDGLVARVRALARSGVDGVLDASGRGVLPESIELTGSPDRVITIADMSAQSLGVRFSGGGGSERAFDALPDLAQAAAAGELQIPVWRTYPLAQASNAHADLEAGANRGKIVLIP